MFKMEEKQRGVRFYVDKNSFLVQTAVILMALSAVFRLIGCWGLWNDPFFAAAQIALPLCCNLLFILCLLLFGRRAFSLTCVPVLAGIVFFIVKAFTFDSWIHTVLCLLLYIGVAALYVLAVFGSVRIKYALTPLFGAVFLYHVFVEDLAALRDAAHPVTFSAGMQEVSVLCVILSMFLTTLAMKKVKREEPLELPKIKAPKVIPPEKKQEEAPLSLPMPEAEATAAAAETEPKPEPAEESGEDK